MEITAERQGAVTVLTMDDGNKNVLNIEGFQTVGSAFDDVDDDASAIVLTGRDGIFTAGLDLKFMQQASLDELHELLVVFGETLMRIWLEPRPTVCAATGHAIAAGSMLAMACDHAVAAEGDFRWGLTETQIGFQLPHFGIALSRHNLRQDRLEDLLLPGAIVGPVDAVEAGFADELAPPEEVLDRALERADALAELPATAYAGTKRRLRGMAAEAVRQGLDDDISVLLEAMP
ncbi:MAG: crotonase/enoyl-CoA hydratase family protein [Nitriliruptorales bacterium]|nr:crotonase/enoyl-CoA hydratase family protein [Nitriliruptorales bacterium]